jgi:hypothetical protein
MEDKVLAYASFTDMGYLVVDEKEVPFRFVVGSRDDVEDFCIHWGEMLGEKYHIQGHAIPCYETEEE